MIDDLAQARALLEAAREAIRTTPELVPLADRLDRMAGEVQRIQQRLAKVDAARANLR